MVPRNININIAILVYVYRCGEGGCSSPIGLEKDRNIIVQGKKGGGKNRFTFEDTLLLYKYPVAPIIVSIRMRDKTEVRRSDALL